MKTRRRNPAIIMAALLAAALAFSLSPVLPVLADDSGWTDPSANSADPGNLGFNTPQGAYTDGTGLDGYQYAEASPTWNRHQYYGYDFSAMPDTAVIEGIEVRMDAWLRSVSPSYTGSLAVELSWDDGGSWTSTGYSTGNLSYGQSSYYKGGATIKWGHAWTATEVKTAFRVRLVATVSGNSNGRVYTDWVPVKVYYSVPLSAGGDANIMGDVGATLELNAPGAILLGNMTPSGSPYSVSSATPGSVNCNDPDGCTVTVKSNRADGKMASPTPHALNSTLVVTTGSLTGVTVTTTPQSCINTSAPGVASISLSVTQAIDYNDAADSGYSIALTYTATAN